MTKVSKLNYKVIKYLLIIPLIGLTIAGCSKDNIIEPEVSLPSAKVHTIYNIPADTANQNKSTYFRFKDSTIVSGPDTATANWDIAFNKTIIYTNSGSSGPGKGGAIVLRNVNFEDVTEAPETGYDIDSASAPAIPTGSGKGWYHYSGPPNHLITPIPGVVLVIRCGNGKYAKVQILSYYKNAPQNPTGKEPSRFYSFKYFYQDDGSRNLK
ncbi:MAG: HmuY family protein [Melioribacteraceae bacterium]